MIEMAGIYSSKIVTHLSICRVLLRIRLVFFVFI